MPVLLRRSIAKPVDDAWDRWLAVTGTPGDLPAARRLPDLPRRLQDSFDGTRDRWLTIACQLGGHPVGRLSHTATAATYINDFGLMLAWSSLVGALAREPARTLVLCDDPWLFRHLCTVPDVTAGRPPGLWRVTLRLAARGLAARTWLGLRLIHAAVTLREQRRHARPGAPAIITYGHPRSDAAGNDAYFGSLMTEIPVLQRLLHGDCMVPRAGALCRDGRTASIHGWGRAAFAATLPLLRWRLPRPIAALPEAWLLRRAAAQENASGGLAMSRWQVHCQTRWLAAVRPKAIAWPWENHPWERSLVRAARPLGIRTVGYQHAVVGRHQFNFSALSNPDGATSLPDAILCNGPAYRDQLAAQGHDPAALRIAGAFRIARESSAVHDPSGPIYLALSSIRPVSDQMLAAAARLADGQNRFIVKDHPLYPITFRESAHIRRTPLTIPESAGLRAVIYSTGTTGLEGLLAGIPTYRFLPDDRIAPDILPDGVAVPEMTADELAEALRVPEKPARLRWSDVMAPVDMAMWRAALDPAASGCEALPSRDFTRPGRACDTKAEKRIAH